MSAIKLDFQFPVKLQPAVQQAMRYKIIVGGRVATKSWSVAQIFLLRGLQRPRRVLCAREFQASIKESVHRLLSDQIKRLNLSSVYRVLESGIYGPRGSEFAFAGLRHNAAGLKSYEDFDDCWVEEAVNVSRASWDILTPTIRKDDSEIWITLNPELDTDETYQRFVLHPPANAMVIEMNWRDNPWFNEVQREEKDAMYARDPDEALVVWEGKTRHSLKDAIYANELRAAELANRITRVPYDPSLPVHSYWDLGYGNHTSIWLMQKAAMEWHAIGFLQDSNQTLGYYIGKMQALPYVWGTDYLPHDGRNNQLVGQSVESQLKGFGRTVEVLPRDDVTAGINAARTVFPMVYFDREACADGLQCLRHYKWRKNEAGVVTSQEPLHDEYCLGADTKIRTLAGWKRIADLIGQSFHVWGYSHDEGRIVPAKALRCWKTKTVESVAKVTLDNGATITCTPTHRFMRRDGTYCEAQGLLPGESLMPFYERSVNGHVHIHLTDGSIAAEHCYVYSRLVGKLIEGQQVHHKDFTKLNNEPDNLEQLTTFKHRSIHSSTPEHKAHLLRVGNKKGSQRGTQMLVEMNKLRGGDVHHTRQPGYLTDELRRKIGEASSASYKASERTKDCLGCGVSFVGNWKRAYCCYNCKARAAARRRGVPESPYRVMKKHADDCAIAPFNHRVVSVQIINEVHDVYDIEVDGIHNFVAEGVVVHNSDGADAYRTFAMARYRKPKGDTSKIVVPRVRRPVAPAHSQSWLGS